MTTSSSALVIAERPSPESLADVGIQVDDRGSYGGRCRVDDRPNPGHERSAVTRYGAQAGGPGDDPRLVTQQAQPAPDEDVRRFAMLAEITHQAAPERDHRGQAQADGVAEKATLPTGGHDLGGENAFGDVRQSPPT